MALDGFRLEPNLDGIKALVDGGTLEGLQELLDAKAEAVADAARSRDVLVEGRPGDIALPITTRRSNGQRARAVVSIDHPSGLAVEAKHRLLGGSLDAARG